jgi:hypothetical protein
LDKPLQVIPARYSSVRADLAQLNEAPLGCTKRTLDNHKSNAKAALLWLAKEKDIPRYGVPLTPAWEALRGEIADPLVRSRLSSLMRFASARNVAPADLDDAANPLRTVQELDLSRLTDEQLLQLRPILATLAEPARPPDDGTATTH